jgi:hypothetical protein
MVCSRKPWGQYEIWRAPGNPVARRKHGVLQETLWPEGSMVCSRKPCGQKEAWCAPGNPGARIKQDVLQETLGPE